MVMLMPPITIGSGTIVNLGTTDSVTVRKNVLLISSDGFAIAGTGSNQQAIIVGTVYGQQLGVNLGNNGTESGNSVTIEASGTVVSQLYGVICRGTNATVIVHGVVDSSTYGVGLVANGPDTTSTITNTGTISAHTAVYRDGMSTTQTIKLINSGLIEGDVAYGSINAGHFGKDLITNSGRMIGDVNLDGGDDRYDGRKGSLDGEVHGSFGDDTVIGGKEDNVFFGGGGEDALTGGLGSDRLTGDTEIDQFVYHSTKESTVNPAGRDIIVDFSQIEADQINLKAIDANTRAGGNQKFTFIEDNAFHGHAGELRYMIIGSQTLIQADVNGDKKADFAILLDSVISVAAGDFIL